MTTSSKPLWAALFVLLAVSASPANAQLPWETQSRSPSPSSGSTCSYVTVPSNWVASLDRPRTVRFRGQTYYQVGYIDPEEEYVGIIPVFAQRSGRATGSGPWATPHRPISDRDERLAVTAYQLNGDSDVQLMLRVNAVTEWEQRADAWRQQADAIYSPQNARIASGLFTAGEVAFSAALASIGDASSGATAAAKAFTLVGGTLKATSAGLSFIESVTTAPNPSDKSLAPAMVALGELDPDYRERFEEDYQTLNYVNRYVGDIEDVIGPLSTVVNVGRGATDFTAQNWSSLQSLVENTRAAGNTVLVATPAGRQAALNAFTLSAKLLGKSALANISDVPERLVQRDISDVKTGYTQMVYTANLYVSTLEAYARHLADAQEELREPGRFRSAAAYNEALSRYQYRVVRYLEVQYGLTKILYEYATLINNSGMMGGLSVPNRSIRAYAEARDQMQDIYSKALAELESQTALLSLMETQYPDLGRTCR